jgi:ABC-2 type transport system ATP-binding protein
VVVEGDRVTVEMSGATLAVQALLADLAAHDVPVRSAEVSRPTLDDVFLNLTGRSLREGHSTTQSDQSDPTGSIDKQEVFA